MLGLKTLQRLIHRATAPRASAPVSESGPWNVRRFEAAETNRLNSAHWAKAREQSLNVDLLLDLATLRARTTYELSRNPVLEGMVNTFCSDIAGEDGPMLRVLSDRPAYNKALQNLWWNWFDRPEVSGKLSGVDVLKLWVRRLCDSGEYLAQRVTKRDANPVALRLKLIHPRRLMTPMEYVSDANVILGVRRTEAGEPIEYYITEPSRFGAYVLDASRFKTVAARDLIHEFITVEEDQVRGFPLLSTQLQTTADIRDMDAQVLDAVRAAADQAVVWYTDHPDANYLEVNESTEIERRMQQTGPPGWKPMQMTPEQPSVNYIDYRADRMRELGRPFGMPLMMIRLGSEQHNFSSARFDNEIYKRSVRGFRKNIQRHALFSLVDEVKREGELSAQANPGGEFAALADPPKEVDYAFIWQPMVAVDAEKDAQDQESRLRAGTLDFDDACALAGTEGEAQLAKLKRTIEAFREANVPLPEWAQGWGDPAQKQAMAIAAAQQNQNKPQPAANGNGRH